MTKRIDVGKGHVGFHMSNHHWALYWGHLYWGDYAVASRGFWATVWENVLRLFVRKAKWDVNSNPVEDIKRAVNEISKGAKPKRKGG